LREIGRKIGSWYFTFWTFGHFGKVKAFELSFLGGYFIIGRTGTFGITVVFIHEQNAPNICIGRLPTASMAHPVQQLDQKSFHYHRGSTTFRHKHLVEGKSSSKQSQRFLLTNNCCKWPESCVGYCASRFLAPFETDCCLLSTEREP